MSIPCKGDHPSPCRRVSVAQHDLGVLAAVRSSQSPARSAARLLPVTGLAILRSCATSRSPIIRSLAGRCWPVPEAHRLSIRRSATSRRRHAGAVSPQNLLPLGYEPNDVRLSGLGGFLRVSLTCAHDRLPSPASLRIHPSRLVWLANPLARCAVPPAGCSPGPTWQRRRAGPGAVDGRTARPGTGSRGRRG
jgi:hypothetical protein